MKQLAAFASVPLQVVSRDGTKTIGLTVHVGTSTERIVPGPEGAVVMPVADESIAFFGDLQNLRSMAMQIIESCNAAEMAFGPKIVTAPADALKLIDRHPVNGR